MSDEGAAEVGRRAVALVEWALAVDVDAPGWEEAVRALDDALADFLAYVNAHPGLDLDADTNRKIGQMVGLRQALAIEMGWEVPE